MNKSYRQLLHTRGDVQKGVVNTCRLLLLVLAALISHSNCVEAQIYKWVDKNGVIHFGQAPPQDTDGTAKMESTLPTKSVGPNIDHSSVEAEKAQRTEKKPPVVEERAPTMNPQVAAEMYSTSWCGYCRKAREYFQARGIPLIEYDIEVDDAAAQRKRQIDPRPGVPLVVINGQLIHGFVPAMYERALTRRP